MVHFGIGTPSRILKLLQNGERALFVISRLQISSLHAFIHDTRLLSKPRSSLDISASARPRHESFFVSLGKDEALSNTNPGKPIPA